MRFGVLGLGFGVSDFGLRVQVSGFGYGVSSFVFGGEDIEGWGLRGRGSPICVVGVISPYLERRKIHIFNKS